MPWGESLSDERTDPESVLVRSAAGIAQRGGACEHTRVSRAATNAGTLTSRRVRSKARTADASRGSLRVLGRQGRSGRGT